MFRTYVLIFLGLISTALSSARSQDQPVSFARDIRPILAANCFACHGPDSETREAELRLDTYAGATATIDDHQAIVPKDLSKSELIARITTASEHEVMPPVETGKVLSPKQIELLQQWIAEGATYQSHWAFEPPVQPAVPKLSETAWVQSPIDAFVLKGMQEHSLTPSEPADRYALVRRVTLDIIGLPPTLEEAEDFANDSDPAAYEKLVDRLLNSPQYGERWARQWLDLARYADTNGYEKDRERSIWPYRDWVINALNADMPFDEFSVQQLAGDMLPEAGINEIIATGFHRNTMLNEEGGIDPQEYRFYSMVDRVATTGTVWMGMTIGCAQCHTHKYDPITHTDYYRLMALMNNADEPDLRVPTNELLDQRTALEKQIQHLEVELKSHLGTEQEFQALFTTWLNTTRSSSHHWDVLRPARMSTNLPRLELLADGSILSTGDITKRDVFELTLPIKDVTFPISALRLEVLPDERLPANGPGRAFYEGRKGDFFLSELTATLDNTPVKFQAPSHNFGKIAIGSGSADASNVLDGDGSTGWSTATREGEAHQLVLNFAEPITSPAELHVELLFERHFAASLGRFRFSVASSDKTVIANGLPVDLEALCLNEASALTPEQLHQLESYFLKTTLLLEEARKPIEQLRKQIPELPITMVLKEQHPENPRPTHRHHRGEYLKPQEKVQPGIPEIFTTLTKQNPQNRLEFARWLVSDQNPLVGRTVVNRAWQAFFGRGFVNTLGDIGTQSALPTHPALLDWLSTEFTSETGMNWSLKKLHRTIVLSNTYRQASPISKKSLEKDPENVWLARGPRARLEAEIIRDSTLRASGLLSERIGGPSVYPPQPQAVTALSYSSMAWEPSAGSDRYRRSLYTFSKRTTPFAAYTVFDAPTGESCLAQRDRSNTPLQALTLLNDEMFFEAARALATAEFKPESTTEEIAGRIFQRILTRLATLEERQAITDFYVKQLSRFQSGDLKSAEILSEPSASAELAAWVMTARVLFNLDESVTKQ